MASDGEFVSLLRDASLRVTAPRVAMLAGIRNYAHADIDTLTAAVRRRLGTVKRQAVCDVLSVLTEAGLVCRIQPAGSSARFEARIGDNHHHVVCRICNAVGDVDCVIGTAPCLEAGNTDGSTIDEVEPEVTFWGYRTGCQ